MTKEKQIEQMSADIQEAVNGCSSYWSRLIAEKLHDIGYRKRKDLYQILPDGRLELIPTSDNIKSKLAEDLLSEIKKEAHNKAVHPCGCKIDPYISLKVLDGIIQKYINEYYGGK